MKKFAVCFSGYPRFVKLCFDNIKEDFLDGLGEYDIYANFQWNEDWQNTKIHHEFKDTYTTNEIDDFIVTNSENDTTVFFIEVDVANKASILKFIKDFDYPYFIKNKKIIVWVE
jgi:hypothetical protein